MHIIPCYNYNNIIIIYFVGGQVLPASKIMMNIVRKEGLRHLWKGLLPRLIAVPSMMSVFFVINEELEKFFLGTNGIRFG